MLFYRLENRASLIYSICSLSRAVVDIEANEKSIAGPVDVIQKAMGSFGRWHLLVCAVVFLLKFPVAWHQMSIIFIGPPVTFECSDASIKDRCSDSCPAYNYNRTIFTETIITEWNLVCDRSQWANVSQTIFMLGILVGNILFGSLADK